MFNPSNWAWPQWTLFIYTIFCLGVSLVNHGKPYKKETVGSVISATVIEVARLVILIFGGFFARIGWPQVVWIGFMALSWGCYIAMLVTKEEMKGKRRFTSALVTAAIMMTLYIFGGFFA